MSTVKKVLPIIGTAIAVIVFVAIISLLTILCYEWYQNPIIVQGAKF